MRIVTICFGFLFSFYISAQDFSSVQRRVAQELSSSDYTFVIQIRQFENLLLSLGYQKVGSSLEIEPFPKLTDDLICNEAGEVFEGEKCVRTSYTYESTFQKNGVTRKVNAVGSVHVTETSLKFIRLMPPGAVELE